MYDSAEPGGNPYAPRLVAAGQTFDVIEVDARLGREVVKHLRAAGVRVGPVILDRRCAKMGFLVPVSGPDRTRLRDQRGPSRHGLGAWVTFPPPRGGSGPLVWHIAPSENAVPTPLGPLDAAIARAAASLIEHD
ncbi:hypothetical protein B4N89_08980 [Embleya scabrispora]|uniref:DNA primase/polymerase bifunctional N-terminal domain-containing protein n=1 Tax=Embleya scabrispora TaxID=159449 RepID=A0A1T3NWB6_9ACTN|nr:hypothetical protein [Embleya scabrispora]OPC81065.1 hypothetical protein B4N89_08980 [Embleya scabrispora]